MSRIEIGVINPKAEQQMLLEWAACIDAGKSMPETTSQLNFASYRQLHAALTEKRMDLLEYIAQHEGMNIRQIARQIGRDYKNVNEDVHRLSELGLIEIMDGVLYAPYDEISINKTLRRAA